jgi:hypothetical protein
VRSLVVLPSPSTPTRKRGLSLVGSWPAPNPCGIDPCYTAAVPSARPLIGCSRQHGAGTAACSSYAARLGSVSPRCSNTRSRQRRNSGLRRLQGSSRRWSFRLPVHQLCATLLDRLDRLPPPERDALGTAFGLTSGTRPDRFLVGLAFLSVLSDADQEPLLCLIDDAQWLDPCGCLTGAFRRHGGGTRATCRRRRTGRPRSW